MKHLPWILAVLGAFVLGSQGGYSYGVKHSDLAWQWGENDRGIFILQCGEGIGLVHEPYVWQIIDMMNEHMPIDCFEYLTRDMTEHQKNTFGEAYYRKEVPE